MVISVSDTIFPDFMSCQGLWTVMWKSQPAVIFFFSTVLYSSLQPAVNAADSFVGAPMGLTPPCLP